MAGNKSDLQESREVTFLEGSSLAQSNELIFLESSALSGVSVDEIFLKCALRVLNKYEAGELDLKQVRVQKPAVRCTLRLAHPVGMSRHGILRGE